MPKVVYSADDLPENQRLDYWQNAISESFVRLDCLDLPDTPFRGRVASSMAGQVVFSHVDTVAQDVHRTPKLIRGDDAAVFLISFQVKGRGVIAQDGRQAVLNAGDFALYDSTRPYSLHFDADFEQLVLHMPRALLAARLGRCEALTARRVGARVALAGLASDFVVKLVPLLNRAEAQPAEKLGRIALDLVSVAFSAMAERDPLAQGWAAEGILRRAKELVEARLHEDDLSTPALAADLGISPRRLQEAFASEGTSPTAWLWKRRLERARDMLSDPASAATSISEVAFACGFRDSAHFSHRFRARFEVSPREWRQGQGARS